MSSRPVSGAWRYFKIKEHNERMAECTLCNSEIPRGRINAPKASFSVHPLWSHLKVYHKDEHRAAEKIKEEAAANKHKLKIEKHEKKRRIYTLCNMNNTSQPTLTELLENKRPWPNTSLENKNNTDRLLKWLIDSMEPYSVVQNKLFKEFVQGEK